MKREDIIKKLDKLEEREYSTLSFEEIKEIKELRLRLYISTCLIYGEEDIICENNKIQVTTYNKDIFFNYLGKRIIDDERALEIFNEQKEEYIKEQMLCKQMKTQINN